MARFSEYAPDLLLAELDTLLLSVAFLKSKIRITEELRLLAAIKFPKSLQRSVDSGQTEAVFTHKKVQQVLAKHFKSEWEAMGISRRRIEHLLADGDIDILDCDARTRHFWKTVWRYIEKLPKDIHIVSDEDDVSTDFGDQCRSLKLPEESVGILVDYFADHRDKGGVFPENMPQKIQKILKGQAQGMSHSAITTRFDISTGYSRKLKSQHRAVIEKLQATMGI